MLGIRRNSLSYKTSILYIILTVLISSVFNFIIWENQSDLITRNQQVVAENQSVKMRQLIAKVSGDMVNKQDQATYEKIFTAVTKENIKEMMAFSEAGEPLYYKGPGKSPAVPPEEKVIVNRSIAKYELEDKEFYHDIDIKSHLISLYIPMALPKSGETVVFKFPLTIKGLEEDKNVLLRLCLLVTFIVMVLQFIFAMFLRKIVIIPLTKLERITHAVSKGDFNQTIDVKQNDEIGMLASGFQEMVLNLVRIREEAKGANPLSGLPGNNVIVKEIENCISKGVEFAVIYGDLDNFKAYNDKYGFSKGDDAILYTRDAFLEAAKKFGDDTTFVGHEGGDDFVTVTSYTSWEAVCKGIVSTFDSGVNQFYNEVDAKQGFIDSVDRQGKRVRFPLMSISLAVASNHYQPISDHRKIVSIAAEMKKYVKKVDGSNYAIDKRSS